MPLRKFSMPVVAAFVGIAVIVSSCTRPPPRAPNAGAFGPAITAPAVAANNPPPRISMVDPASGRTVCIVASRGVTYSAPMYPYDAARALPRERDAIRFLESAPLDAQVRLDIALHDLAISNRTFSGDGSASLAEGTVKKQAILSLLSPDAPEPRSRDVADALAHLRWCQSVHHYYLSIAPTDATGSHTWHRAWLSAYDRWIASLESPSADQMASR